MTRIFLLVSQAVTDGSAVNTSQKIPTQDQNRFINPRSLQARRQVSFQQINFFQNMRCRPSKPHNTHSSPEALHTAMLTLLQFKIKNI